MANEKVLAKLLSGKPGIYHLFVRHDDWCLMLAGGGVCNCNPEEELIEQTKQTEADIVQRMIDDYERLRRLQNSRQN